MSPEFGRTTKLVDGTGRLGLMNRRLIRGRRCSGLKLARPSTCGSIGIIIPSIRLVPVARCRLTLLLVLRRRLTIHGSMLTIGPLACVVS